MIDVDARVRIALDPWDLREYSIGRPAKYDMFVPQKRKNVNQ
jgi:hypothetical protein